MKYTKGDKVRIISNENGNKFKLGEIVRIKTVNARDENYKVYNKQDYWWVTDDEIKSVRKTKKTTK